jgi:hypothetical protein
MDDVLDEAGKIWQEAGGCEQQAKRQRGTKHRAGKKIQLDRMLKLLRDIQSDA